ncbi:MAG TPA: ABC transporter permease [Thermoanaerobaculia bacterium]|nr:ABC transporter permease [Thermoanaerobaculia bacterium]
MPTRGLRGLDLRELWAYRELLYILTWRDLKVRYRQTFLGILWVMAQPLVTMLFFTFFFNRVARIEAGRDIPYSVFVMAGLLAWNFFSMAAASSGNSLIGSTHLISKIYFPRLIIPAASVLTAVVDFCVAALLLIGLMAWHQLLPPITIIVLPLLVVLALLLALGIGLWLSALNVEYRDVRVVVPFLLQLWMYATPVVYPLKVLPETLQKLAVLNPMTGIVEAFRACVLGTELDPLSLVVSAAGAVVLLGSGTIYFRTMERRFADLI